MPSRRRRRACCRPRCPRYNCYVPYTPAPAGPLTGVSAPPGPCEECARLTRKQEELMEQLARVRGESKIKDARIADVQNILRASTDEVGRLRALESTTSATLDNALQRARAVSDKLRRHLEESRQLDALLETILASVE